MKLGNAGIGLFVVGGLLLFGIGMFLIGDRHQAFARHTEYYSEFVNLAGLSSGATVRVGGMDAGQVLAISVPDSPSSRFRVKWRIDSKLSALVRTDSVATISTEGVVGGTFLSVRPGSAQAPQAHALATIPSKEPMELSAMLARGAAVLDDAQAILKRTDAKLNLTLDTVTSTVSNLNDVVVDIKAGRGTVGMLLKDEALADRIRQTVTTTSSDLQDIVADVKAGRGAAGMLLRDEAVASQIRDAVKNAQQASADLGHASRQAGEVMDNLRDSSRQIHQVTTEFTEPDQQGMSAGTNIRDSLTHASVAASNLADATEALKHNFFLRGFFKSRGYYNLTDISPERYRRDRNLIRHTDRRVWVQGSELFQTGTDGGEVLSAQGRAFLNTTVAEYGYSIIDSPVVIEGYWNGPDPADQIRFSRRRAMLVRQYLQTHFQLQTSKIGLVPMKNRPPDGAGRRTWDGICIVILKGN
jgi:phospholipid/cholesterol/gamma-HCH transport system substrate-binding protein